MRIQNNIESMNAYRNLNNTNRALSKSLERLSSGFRINRAADDAAGLAISEKMRSQIRGLDQAVRNAQDGISLIQTAEGALNETHAILQRMRELASQAANDTYTTEDHTEIQREMDLLTAEITRIANSTEFNTSNLLDGGFTGEFQIGANSGQMISFEIADMSATGLLGVAGNGGNGEVEGTGEIVVQGGEGSDAVAATGTGSITVDTNTHEITITGGEHEDYNITVAFTTGADAGSETAALADGTLTLALNDGADYTAANIQALIEGADFTGTEITASNFAVVVADDGTDEFGNATGAQWAAVTDIALTGGAEAIAPDNGGEENGGSAGGLDVSSRAGADAAIGTISTAIDRVSTERSKLGALQNRLDHTITNLEVASENLTAAESRIRDVDMAAEMMEFTKNQILTQAGTAMLAQANMAPQAVLQLTG